MGNSSWSGGRRAFPASIRRRILAAYPMCAACHVAPSTIADHVIPVAEGGTDDIDNGQGMCAACHNRKTRAEIARGRARKSPKRPPERHPGLR